MNNRTDQSSAGRRTPRRRGGVLVYATFLMVILLALVSLGADYAHVQSVKTEEQRAADLCARGLLQMYTTWGPAIVGTYQSQLTYLNGTDGKFNSGYATPAVTWGTYDPSTGTFTPSAGIFSAVRVVMSRTAAGGNPVKLIFPLLSGNGRSPVKTSVDVSATAIAYFAPAQSGSLNVPRNANPYLAGEPAGTTVSGGWGDDTTSATPYQMTSIAVTPGQVLTFTNLSGSSSIVPGHVNSTGPGGDPTLVLHHGQNYNSNPNPPYPNPENGVADAKMPADALSGLFLTDNPPDQASPPPAVDWTDAAHADQATYNTLKVQQPFLIGAGQTTGGATQTFTVPAGATRLFLGVWDGVCYHNNAGGLTGTINSQSKIMLVR